jgi:hypothetical protein
MFSKWRRFLCKHVMQILISTLMDLKATLSKSLIQLRLLDEGSVFFLNLDAASRYISFERLSPLGYDVTSIDYYVVTDG